jgi:hypothetical protein
MPVGWRFADQAGAGQHAVAAFLEHPQVLGPSGTVAIADVYVGLLPELDQMQSRLSVTAWPLRGRRSGRRPAPQRRVGLFHQLDGQLLKMRD